MIALNQSVLREDWHVMFMDVYLNTIVPIISLLLCSMWSETVETKRSDLSSNRNFLKHTTLACLTWLPSQEENMFLIIILMFPKYHFINIQLLTSSPIIFNMKAKYENIYNNHFIDLIPIMYTHRSIWKVSQKKSAHTVSENTLLMFYLMSQTHDSSPNWR